MKSILKIAAVGAVAVLTTAAGASPTVDGAITAGEYAGATQTFVPYLPGSPTYYPSDPGPTAEQVAYTVYFTSDMDRVYVGLQTNPAGMGLDGADSQLLFANLYFNTDGVGGSDLGFEVTNRDAFIPATGVKTFDIDALGAMFVATPGSSYANGGAPQTIEFSVPWTFFTTDVLGLGQPLTAPGGTLQLRTSQSFNYNGVTGTPVTRFGSVIAPVAAAVPEPASWAMMIGGFGLVGGALRNRRRTAALAA